jgi:hypothetical protein
MITNIETRTTTRTDETYSIANLPIQNAYLTRSYLEGNATDDYYLHTKLKSRKNPLHVGYLGVHTDIKTILNSEFDEVDCSTYESYTLKDLDGFDETKLFYTCPANNFIFDHKLRPFPKLYKMSYIGCIFTDEYMDLEKALPILKKSEYITNRDSLHIENIPYYNACENSSRFIQVDFLPSVELMRTKWDKYKDNKVGFPSVKMSNDFKGFASTVDEYKHIIDLTSAKK